MIKYLLFSVMVICSCNSNNNSGCENGELVTLQDFTGLDGCSWMLVKKDNSSLEPINLTEFISQPMEGDTYEVTYEVRTDLASICLVGTIVKITCATKK